MECDVFELFKGKNGKFMENLRYDIRGLMELYEASQLCIEGENILDEAAIFSSHMLQKALDFLDDKEARMDRYTLENPHRRNITYFSLLNAPKDCDATILKELADLEYMMVQSIRRMEINEILRYNFTIFWETLCDAFLVEAKWFASGHIPKSEEYLKNTNDLESEEDESQDGHDGSYVKCFIMEHEYCSAKIAREYVKKIISDAWKCLNKECLSPSPFSENFLKGSINLARFVPSMYSYSHNNSLDLIEEYIRSIL
ncbi:hypothetical protein L1987_86328 [Smallanthus sonchifolius]|uniref:Uncharacterized protein n=1 Tax=Smallanthus sonchifolius TaxID=185202 RepID=A0ACB8Y371_9ASTR|nr:hypothetical protein L1987_86328 [Smallanthus sonchifolius]